MLAGLPQVRSPELVFGIAGPIGVDINSITENLESCLKAVGYIPCKVRITEEMKNFPAGKVVQSGQDYSSLMNYKIDYANALCKEYNDPATLIRIAVRAIGALRREITGNLEALAEKRAYIILQLKRPQEVVLLRQIYGQQFVLVSAYGSAQDRKKAIVSKIRKDLSAEQSPNAMSKLADDLISRDANEDSGSFGQHLRDTFHMADVFVDGINKEQTERKLNRFIQAFFGRTDIAPSKEEYGMYAAASAALRSSDLSRQVGAAIFTPEGELISQGCNEVPRAFGGTYWDLEAPDHRDVKLGHDPNDALKEELLRDLFTRLDQAGLLSETALLHKSVPDLVKTVTEKKEHSEQDPRVGALSNALVMDLTEYGRVVHAEMCAICDAARHGRAVKGSILFCTTFPCHNCTKHIIAAGIRRVVFMEPYPKSRAKDLHENEISIEHESSNKVSMMPFLGISPFRYRDIFQKGRRKSESGQAKRWYCDEPQPMLSSPFTAYIEREDEACLPLLGGFKSTS